MEECASQNNNNTKKRARDDSGVFEPNSPSPEMKRVNAATTDSDPDQSEPERVESDTMPDSARSDSPESEICQLDSEDNSAESNGSEEGDEFASPAVAKFREDILDMLDEPETVPEAQDLDSVIRSFEEEILQLSPSLARRSPTELTSYPGGPQPDLGYLLEASDDELGLPPTVSAAEDQKQNEPIILPAGDGEGVNGLANMAGFEDDFQGYGSYDFGITDGGAAAGENYAGNSNGDFVAVDGLFDYTDGSDFVDLAWRPESLPAL